MVKGKRSELVLGPRAPKAEVSGGYVVPIMVRVNQAQREAFTGCARRMGLPLSAWVRMILLQELSKKQVSVR